MTTFTRTHFHVPGTNISTELLKTVVTFCGVGLFVWLLFATYGLDLSPGLF